ncbi:hypothetical protein ACJZ2D_016397 [Fusarium nematophilum]
MGSLRRSTSSGPFLAIAIDFGTTYSGVSYALSTTPDSINQIHKYPGSHHGYNDPVQVPTLLDLESGAWGYEVAPSMKPIKWFKLLLLKEDDIPRADIRDWPHVRDARRQLLARHETPVSVVGKFLRKIWEHALQELRTKMTVDGLPFKVAITVPAIWPPYAEKAMREAAKIAGILDERDIGETTLELVQEPEAAGLSILHERKNSPEIQTGESFVVCDAGGGTVDVISYIITSIAPYQVKECVNGDGRLAGATLIDEAFEKHIATKTNLRISELGLHDYQTFVAKWEMNPKRQFNGRAEQPAFILEPPIKAFSTWNRVRKKTDFAISAEEMRFFFEKSYTGIRTLINDQVKEVEKRTGKKPKHIFLVGGLGDSPYIYDKLQRLWNPIKVFRPNSRWSAVAHGAVMRLMRDGLFAHKSLLPKQQVALDILPEVTARKSRYSYGVVARHKIRHLKDYDKGVDRLEKDAEGQDVTYRMNWYLLKGSEVSRRQPVHFYYTKDIRGRLPPKCNFDIIYSDADVPPKRPGPGVQNLCRIECDWDKPFEQWKRVGNPADGWRRHENLTLAMTFEGGQPKWHLKVGANQVRREVLVDYMS